MADANLPSTSVQSEKQVKEIDPSLAPLTHFVDRPDDLADHTLSSIDWNEVVSMMPRILKGKSKEDVRQLLLAEIDGMSKKRLLAVLNGHDFEESSSSEDEEEEEEEKEVEEEKAEEEASEGVVEKPGETEEVGDRQSEDVIGKSGQEAEDGEIKSGESEVEEEEEEEEIDEQKAFDKQIDEDLNDMFD